MKRWLNSAILKTDCLGCARFRLYDTSPEAHIALDSLQIPSRGCCQNYAALSKQCKLRDSMVAVNFTGPPGAFQNGARPPIGDSLDWFGRDMLGLFPWLMPSPGGMIFNTGATPLGLPGAVGELKMTCMDWCRANPKCRYITWPFEVWNNGPTGTPKPPLENMHKCYLGDYKKPLVGFNTFNGKDVAATIAGIMLGQGLPKEPPPDPESLRECDALSSPTNVAVLSCQD